MAKAGWLALLAAMPAAGAQYEPPASAPAPEAQLAEMVDLYDRLCLRTFPDDRGVAKAVAAMGATRLSRDEVHAYLHDDPGVGWHVAGKTARFDVTIEGPPYHACTVRSMTSAGFADLAPYQAVVERYQAGRGHFVPIGPYDAMIGSIRSTGQGVAAMTPDGGGDALLWFVNKPTEDLRAPEHSAVEIRFVHQVVAPGTR